MEVFRVLSAVSLGERVDLDPEGDALLPAMLPGSELCADAVHLQTGAQAFYECAVFKVALPTGGTKRQLCVCVLPAQTQRFFSSCPTGTLRR